MAYGRGTYGQLWLSESLDPSLREDVISRLSSDIDALRVDGEPRSFHVLRGKDLYDGPHASAGPDIYLEPNRPTIVPNNRLDYAESDPVVSLLTNLDPERDYGFSGWHGPAGILIASGARVRQDAGVGTNEASVLDVAPTIFDLLRFPIASRNGRPPSRDLLVPSSIRPDRREPLPARVKPRAQDVADSKAGLTSEEEVEIVEHLRGLGYL